VWHTQRVLEVSERRSCQVLGQARSTQRYEFKRWDLDQQLVGRMDELRRERPRYGYRRIWRALVREGWRVNLKRVHRLWKEAGWQIRRKAKKKRRLGSSENGCTQHRSERRNHVWSYDFVFDRTEDGRQLKFMPVLDEYTRESLALEVERSLTGEDVVDTLAYLFQVHGEPAFIRSDNGPEFVSKVVKKWPKDSGVKTLFIEPGSPWENAYVESFNSRLREEFLNQEIFTSLTEAQVLAEQHRVFQNLDRPHNSLGYLTPAEFAALDEAGRFTSPRCGKAPDSHMVGGQVFTLS